MNKNVFLGFLKTHLNSWANPEIICPSLAWVYLGEESLFWDVQQKGALCKAWGELLGNLVAAIEQQVKWYASQLIISLLDET